MTSTTLRPALWSGHEWLDRLRPEHRILTGTAYRIAKRVGPRDRVGHHSLWVPLLAVCAIAIKLDDPRAPVVFVQKRAGVGDGRSTCTSSARWSRMPKN